MMVRESRCAERPPGFFLPIRNLILLSVMRLLLSILVLVLLLGACRDVNEKPHVADSENGLVEPPRASLVAFQKINMTDPVTGLKVLSCLVPDTWQTQTQTWWTHADYLEPFKQSLLIVNPIDSAERIQLYPTLSYFTSTNQSGIGPDSSIADPTILIRTPQLCNTAVDAIRDYLIPAFRPGIRDVRFKELVPLSSIDLMDENGKPFGKETGMVRVAYLLHDQMVEEAFFATLSKRFVTVDRYNTHCRWHIEAAVSCRSHEGFLDEQLRNLQTTLGTMRYDIDWTLKLNAVLNDIQPHADGLTADVLQASIRTSATDPREAKGVYQSFQRRLSRTARAYIKYQPMLATYAEQSGALVELPDGFTVAWKNSSDRYVLSDSITYRPPADDVSWYEIKLNQSRQGDYTVHGATSDDEEFQEEINKM